MKLLLTERGCESREGDLAALHEQFNQVLLQEARGKAVLLIIDEAQNVRTSVLERFCSSPISRLRRRNYYKSCSRGSHS